MHRPEPDEYNSYYHRYISLVDRDDVIAALATQANETAAFLATFREDQGDRSYGPGKWSVKQVVGHLIDAERIFAHRAHHIARNDSKPLDGFEQDDYVLSGGFEHRTLSGLIEEFKAVRNSTNFLFAHIQPDACVRRGVANGNEITVRAIAWIIAGHELHHRLVLKEKYAGV
jgi:hypothetical protein